MTSPDADTEHSLRRTTHTLVLEASPACSRAKGVLTPADLAGIEGYALDFPRGLCDRAETGARVAGARLEQDVCKSFLALGDIETHGEAERD